MKTDIILSGVGGQGILSIAAIIGEAALAENLYIKQAEVHGMSQRGGDRTIESAHCRPPHKLGSHCLRQRRRHHIARTHGSIALPALSLPRGVDYHLFGSLRQYPQLSRRTSTESRIAKTAPCHHARRKRIGERTQSSQMRQCNIAWSRSQIVANHRILRSRKKHRPCFCQQRPSRHRDESQSSIDRV